MTETKNTVTSARSVRLLEERARLMGVAERRKARMKVIHKETQEQLRVKALLDTARAEIETGKPNRRELIAVIARLQDHIGDALQYIDSDTHPDAKARMRRALENAHDLCIATRKYDPP